MPGQYSSSPNNSCCWLALPSTLQVTPLINAPATVCYHQLASSSGIAADSICVEIRMPIVAEGRAGDIRRTTLNGCALPLGSRWRKIRRLTLLNCVPTVYLGELSGGTLFHNVSRLAACRLLSSVAFHRVSVGRYIAHRCRRSSRRYPSGDSQRPFAPIGFTLA